MKGTGWMGLELSTIFTQTVGRFDKKVTKFLSKISQFEFLFMTKKNYFPYKPLSLNIYNFNLYVKIGITLPPPQKSHPLFLSNPPLTLRSC